MEFSGDGREVILLLPVTGTLDTEKKKEKKKWWEILWYGENRIKTLEKTKLSWKIFFSQIRYNGADRRCEGGAFLSFSPKVLVMLSQAACREA